MDVGVGATVAVGEGVGVAGMIKAVKSATKDPVPAETITAVSMASPAKAAPNPASRRPVRSMPPTPSSRRPDSILAPGRRQRNEPVLEWPRAHRRTDFVPGPVRGPTQREHPRKGY